tara:strand:- start:1548 stop:2630 length:1083 start_codon:yes stop_codon:yes gene_type:complete
MSDVTTAPKPETPPGDEVRLFRRYGARGWWIPVMLTIALVFNILALTIPFLELSMLLEPVMIYDLPRSVWMMWTQGLYLISILILGFSIIFPLLKLLGMYTAWFGAKTFKRQERILGLVKNLGKWSFMDIFVVSLLLALTNDQWAISATPRIGVYFFILAILISMATSEILHSMMLRLSVQLGHASPPKDPAKLGCPLVSFRWRGWFIGVMLILAMLTFIAAVGFPFLKIRQVMLSDLAYNILEVVRAVLDQKQPVIATVLFLSLVIMPSIRIMGAILLWFGLFKERTRRRLYRWVGRIARWSMLDVLGLALFLVLTEGQRMIQTQVLVGLYFVICSILLAVVLPQLAGRLDPSNRCLAT